MTTNDQSTTDDKRELTEEQAKLVIRAIEEVEIEESEDKSSGTSG